MARGIPSPAAALQVGNKNSLDTNSSQITDLLLDALVERIAERVAEKLRPLITGVACTPDHEPLISIKEAAAYLSISTSTLYKRKDIPWVKVGGRLAYRRSELDTWLKDNKPPSAVKLAPW